MNKLYLKSLMIRSPFEQIIRRGRWRSEVKAWQHAPELLHLALEDTKLDAAVTRFVRPDSACLDIGCHLGSMLSLFCRLAPGNRHHAFEPIPQSAQRLRKKFPEVAIHEAALSETSGRASFRVSKSVPGHSSLQDSGEQGQTETIDVKVSTLDEEMKDAGKVDVIKLDVEGAELAVLKGGAQVIQESRPVIQFECSRTTCVAFDYEPLDLFDQFASMDYAVLSLSGAITKELPTLPREVFGWMHTYPWYGFNYVAVPQERREAFAD